jgi:hypothetical protein
MSDATETLLFEMSYSYMGGGEKAGVISKER